MMVASGRAVCTMNGHSCFRNSLKVSVNTTDDAAAVPVFLMVTHQVIFLHFYTQVGPVLVTLKVELAGTAALIVTRAKLDGMRVGPPSPLFAQTAIAVFVRVPAIVAVATIVTIIEALVSNGPRLGKISVLGNPGAEIWGKKWGCR